MVDYMNARGKCPDCGEFRGWADGSPHRCKSKGVKLEKFDEIWQSLINELKFAIDKYPPFNSGHEGYAIIKEELDELWEVVRLKQETSGRIAAMQKEATQVAAMAIRFIFDLDNFRN